MQPEMGYRYSLWVKTRASAQHSHGFFYCKTGFAYKKPFAHKLAYLPINYLTLDWLCVNNYEKSCLTRVHF